MNPGAASSGRSVDRCHYMMVFEVSHHDMHLLRKGKLGSKAGVLSSAGQRWPDPRVDRHAPCLEIMVKLSDVAEKVCVGLPERLHGVEQLQSLGLENAESQVSRKLWRPASIYSALGLFVPFW